MPKEIRPHEKPPERLPNGTPELSELLLEYQASHGEWRKVHVTKWYEGNSFEHWEFTPCQCKTCQRAEAVVGHPARPNEE